MIICQVDAGFSALGKEDIEQELKVIEDVLAAIGGELIHADVSMGHGRLVAYVRAESELVVSDVLDASYFTVETITYLKPSHEPRIHINIRKCLSNRDGQMPCGPDFPVFASARRPACPPKTSSLA